MVAIFLAVLELGVNNLRCQIVVGQGRRCAYGSIPRFIPFPVRIDAHHLDQGIAVRGFIECCGRDNAYRGAAEDKPDILLRNCQVLNEFLTQIEGDFFFLFYGRMSSSDGLFFLNLSLRLFLRGGPFALSVEGKGAPVVDVIQDPVCIAKSETAFGFPIVKVNALHGLIF